ncbi:ArsR/SmtB family transcription factor [Clostridium sp. 'White wine YQ']|uniref:ArsR/SmtB family transcription factor n=1 Tax=Clostridium sp. 'White wine YQ' TaxID=3027474 RepID=UPI00236554AC|nr:metalloregulator ArsR/SmtB family transcription factor [Clostridium sp. 'White wine YQ']MDD7793508.1 metalloregulator ArsR/SmtB family transcription factor [Clostridium sp. 'White wine YQ']
MKEYAKEIAELLKVLANENRLMIVCHLIEGPLNVSELHGRLDNLTQSALSQHLSMLKAHRILESNKNGLTITYSIRDERVVKLIEVLKANYCEI